MRNLEKNQEEYQKISRVVNNISNLEISNEEIQGLYDFGFLVSERLISMLEGSEIISYSTFCNILSHDSTQNDIIHLLIELSNKNLLIPSYKVVQKAVLNRNYDLVEHLYGYLRSSHINSEEDIDFFLFFYKFDALTATFSILVRSHLVRNNISDFSYRSLIQKYAKSIYDIFLIFLSLEYRSLLTKANVDKIFDSHNFFRELNASIFLLEKSKKLTQENFDLLVNNAKCALIKSKNLSPDCFDASIGKEVVGGCLGALKEIQSAASAVSSLIQNRTSLFSTLSEEMICKILSHCCDEGIHEDTANYIAEVSLRS